MGLILFLIIGAVAGWLAAKFMNKSQGLFMNLIVGIVGAYVGGFLARALGISATNAIGELIVATAGAIVLLIVLRAIRKA